ncbi:MAG: trimethylamine methyltransferase family protein [Deltaproteobacteria bacterium]|jgi:trimethylamine--corrinoid protein Co-methyltransferase|nr:trimethylamine methyltransferase family protein [Deltaproteobacteria bacterium]
MLKTARGGIGEVRFLTDADMVKIHAQSLELLRKIGVAVTHAGALKHLADCGADVDFKTQRVTFHASLVEKALQTVPRTITLAGRNPTRDIVLAPGGKMFTRNSGGMTQIVDPETQAIREATLADSIDFTRLADALDHIHVVAPLYPGDVPMQTLDLNTLQTMLLNTDKHISVRALNPKAFAYIVQMAAVITGGTANLKNRPIISILESPISPLTFPDVLIDALYTGGKYGIPVAVCSTPNIGATGPITLAGSLLLANTEQLAAIVISQLSHPGAPLIWAPRFPAMDMSTGITGMLTEGAIISAAAAQLAVLYYQLICDFHGPATNAIFAGSESIFQACIAAFVTAFAGRPAILCGAGALELGITASYADLVIGDELFAVLERIIEGIRVDDDTLAVGAISGVGIGGHYLDHPHPLDHLRDERLNTILLKPGSREQRFEQGGRNLVHRAGDIASKLLKDHQPEALDEKMQEELRVIIGIAQDALD